MKHRTDLRLLVWTSLLALAVMTSACASSGVAARPRPFPAPAGAAAAAPPPSKPSTSEPAPAAPVSPPRPTLQQDEALIATALGFRGTPYRNGGSDPQGFDCSGFTQWVFAQHGIALPRQVEEQFKVGQNIAIDDLQPGDLVFFHTESRGASHVGIFVADEQFIHAPSSKGVVRVEYISANYWTRRFVGARRVPLQQQQEPPVATARSAARGSKSAD
jgi:cell wall-associated NlpC family hydrolase